MILLLGASGYVGQAFARLLRRRQYSFVPLSRRAIDYSDFDLLFSYVRKMRPEFVINAAGYPGRPTADACETEREETLAANTLLPQTVARVCAMTKTAWGHVSSGSIYQGAKVLDNGRLQIHRDINQHELRRLFAGHPELFLGFTEWDEPNCTFRHPPCSFYSGSKALAEEALRDLGRGYIWRPNELFDESSEPRNLIWHIQNEPKVYDGMYSVSHLEDFVEACLELWERQAPYGTYNVVNPGAVTTREITGLIEHVLDTDRPFEFWNDEAEFHATSASIVRSNCILDTSKLLSAGVRLRPALEALESALDKWQGREPATVWTDFPTAVVGRKSLDSRAFL